MIKPSTQTVETFKTFNLGQNSVVVKPIAFDKAKNTTSPVFYAFDKPYEAKNLG